MLTVFGLQHEASRLINKKLGASTRASMRASRRAKAWQGKAWHKKDRARHVVA